MNQNEQINNIIHCGNPVRFKSHPNLQYDMFASINYMMKGSMAQ